MHLIHVALRVSSEENALAFYRDLLGLEFRKRFDVPPDLMNALFGMDRAVEAVVYGNESATFELFLTGESPAPDPPDHVCFGVPDLDAFLERCAAAAVKIIQAPKGDGLVTFIHDFDGNRFEVKGA
jgi:catechol 2,3-dioxygenase-like lactoylglutathione lyase family enzyme